METLHDCSHSRLRCALFSVLLLLFFIAIVSADLATGSKAVRCDFRTEAVERGEKFVPYIDGHRITFKEFFRYLNEASSSIQSCFFESIQNFNAEALFFECPPVTRDRFDKDYFEYVLIASEDFNGVTASPADFSEHFRRAQGQDVTSFKNLGGDATLIVPVRVNPTQNFQDFTHLQAFMKRISHKHLHKFWARVTEEVQVVLQSRPGDTKLWISTSGLGVYWLHVRLDSRPKYYQYRTYKDG